MTTGKKIRLKGRGSPGRLGGPPGDLFIKVTVRDHHLFGRAGNDLTLEVPITFAEPPSAPTSRCRPSMQVP